MPLGEGAPAAPREKRGTAGQGGPQPHCSRPDGREPARNHPQKQPRVPELSSPTAGSASSKAGTNAWLTSLTQGRRPCPLSAASVASRPPQHLGTGRSFTKSAQSHPGSPRCATAESSRRPFGDGCGAQVAARGAGNHSEAVSPTAHVQTPLRRPPQTASRASAPDAVSGGQLSAHSPPWCATAPALGGDAGQEGALRQCRLRDPGACSSRGSGSRRPPGMTLVFHSSQNSVFPGCGQPHGAKQKSFPLGCKHQRPGASDL